MSDETGGSGATHTTKPRRVLKHAVVREHLREVVRDAAPGTPAPSERELVAKFNVARMTVRQAVDALVAEGVLERSPGRGTFVAARREPDQRVLGYSEEAQRAGLSSSSRTLVTRLIPVTPALEELFGGHLGAELLQWERLLFVDGQVTAVQLVYLNLQAVGAWQMDRPPLTLYGELARRGIRPDAAEDVLKAGEATPLEGRMLELEPGSTVLRQQRRATAGGVTVEVSSTVHRPDRVRLRFHSGG